MSATPACIVSVTKPHSPNRRRAERKVVVEGGGESVRANEQLRLRRTQKSLPADPLMAELDRLVERPQTYETLGIRALDEEDWQTAAENFRRVKK